MQQDNIELFFADTDDAWARDVAPTFVKSNKHNTANSNKKVQIKVQTMLVILLFEP